jgi:hypothetical protein
MTVSLLGAAAPGFDRPLEVLEACHGRIAKQCDTLDKLLAHLRVPAGGPASCCVPSSALRPPGDGAVSGCLSK